MKKILIVLMAAALSIMTVSCDLLWDILLGEGTVGVGDGFWVRNFATGKDYKVSAQLMASNNLCEVWVENGRGITEKQARDIANEYINNIYPKMTSVFSWTKTIVSVGTFDTLKWADYLTEGNGKLTILLLDIQDNYARDKSYVAGYFYGPNLLPGDRSNQRVMIYMDINPSLSKGMDEFYGTLAHEMQHLMNLATSILYMITYEGADGNLRLIPNGDKTTKAIRGDVMDTWIDEGLASAAEYIYSGKVSKSRIDYYNDDKTGYISKGDNFYLWENYEEENPNAVLNDYATVSIFFQWLRLQFGDDIYKRIFESPYTDYQAISSLDLFNNPVEWSELFGYWHIANYMQHPDNIFGYKNDPDLKTVKISYLNKTDATHSLYPGEAVYTYSPVLNNAPNSGGGILYYGIGNNDYYAETIPAKGALLSFNSDTNYRGSSKVVTITGSEPPPAPSAQIADNSRSLAGALPESYRIDAGDLIRRAGSDKFDLSSLLSGMKAGNLLLKENENE